MRVHRERKEAGFTLVETIVVVSVLAVLAAILIFAVGSTADTTKRVACKADRAIIRTALESYKSTEGDYPTAAQGLGVLVTANYLKAAPDPARWLYDPTGDVIGIGPCLALPGTDAPTATGTVTVFAATSLTNAFNDMKAKLAAVDPGLTVVISYAGSNALKAQINTGTSPADVFAAADTLNSPNASLVGSNQLFASNKLALITRPGNPAGVGGIGDLFTSSLQVVLCQTGVPCGTASDTAFATLGKTRSQIPNLVSQTANVGLVTSAVTSGAPNTVGIVYTTDAAAAGSSVTTVSIADGNNAVNHYPIYGITSGPDQPQAAQFISYILSSEGQALLAARGFGPP